MAARVYCISAEKDDEHLRALQRHTKTLQRSKALELHDRSTAAPGSLITDDQAVQQAQLVLVLMTAAVIEDDDSWSLVLGALGRRQPVVPLLVQPCDIEGSELREFKALPRNGQWIERTGADISAEWNSVCQELKLLLADLPAPGAAQAVLPPKPRCLGRDQDLQALVAQLAEPEPSILLGGAGLGKTTLLVTAMYAPAVAARYNARRYFVRCDSATTCDGVVREVAKELGIPLSPQLEQAVLARLREGPTLLALDNAETPWEADRGPVEELLTTWAAACKLVLTLRGTERPGLLPFLPALTPRRLDLNDARQVFLATAGDKHAQDPLLDQLVKAVDLLPLALTLLAHRAEPDPDLSSVWADWQEQGTAALQRGEDRLNNLDRSLSLSIHGPRMRACPAALRLLALLGFLPDGIHRDDLEALLPGESREAARTLRRVGLAFDEGSVVKVLAPMREHTRRCYPPADADGSRAMALYLTRAKEVGGQVGKAGGADASARISAESGNIEAVVARALEQDRHAEAVPALVGFGRFARFSGYRGCVVELLTEAAMQSPAPSDRARCLERLGEITFVRSDHAEARARIAAALHLFQQVGDLHGQANCIRSLGNIALERSDHAEARARYDAALPLFQQVGDLLGQANCIRSLGNIALERSDHAEARARYDAALPLFRQVNDFRGQANCLHGIGDIALRRADFAEARACFDAAVPLYQQIGDLRGQANCIRSLGDIALELTDLVEARARFGAALPLYQQVGSLLGQANCIRSLGDIALRRADFAEARARFDAALPLYQQVGSRLGQANCIRSLGDIALERADLNDACALFGAALVLYQRIPEPFSIGWTQILLARLCEDPAERRARAAAAFAAWRSIDREDLVQRFAGEFPDAL